MSQYKLSLLIEAQNRATAEIEALKKQIDGLKNQAGPAQKSMDGFLGSMKGVGGGMSLLAGGVAVGAVMAIKDIGLAAVATAGKFEKYEKILGNAMQSQRLATDAMSMLKEVSTQTPFELDKLTESYIKLVNRGFTPTKKEIISLGDLASSQGKQFDQLVEAMLDAQTGEFERLKEFGVRASAQGDKVSFTFKGVTQTVDKTDEAIKRYVLSLGDLGGVQGSMITQSDTYEGRLSNLSDAWTNLSATMGEYFLPMAKSSISAMTDIVNGINTNIQELSRRSESTNENVVFIADIFEYLANLAGPIINFGKSFGISMQQVINSAVNAINPLSGLQNALQNVLSLAGINVDLSIGGIMDKAKNALGSKTKAIVNAQNDIIKKNSLVANPALLGFDKMNQNLAKEMGKLEGIKKVPPKFTGSGGGGGGKKVDAEKQNQVKAEQELIKETQKRIEQVEKLKVTELEKAQMIVKINDDMANKLKVIRGNDQKDAQSRFQSIADKAKEQVTRMQEKFKDLYGSVKDSISKSVDEIKRIDDQIKNGIDKIKELRNSIKDLSAETQQGLSDRYVEVTKEMADTKKQMEQWGVDANEMIGLQEKMASLQKESAFIASRVSETDLNKAIAFDKLTPAEQLVEKQAQKKRELMVEIRAQEEKNLLLEEAKNKEIATLENLTSAKTSIEQSYTKFYKEELQSRQDAYATYISAIKSLASSAPDGVSSVISGAMGMNIEARANGGSVQPGQTYLVGEKGPELFTTKYTGQIIPNGSSQKSDININFNGISINNGMDMQNFKGEVEKVVVKAMRNMQAGIY